MKRFIAVAFVLLTGCSPAPSSPALTDAQINTFLNAWRQALIDKGPQFATPATASCVIDGIRRLATQDDYAALARQVKENPNGPTPQRWLDLTEAAIATCR